MPARAIFAPLMLTMVFACQCTNAQDTPAELDSVAFAVRCKKLREAGFEEIRDKKVHVFQRPKTAQVFLLKTQDMIMVASSDRAVVHEVLHQCLELSIDRAFASESVVEGTTKRAKYRRVRYSDWEAAWFEPLRDSNDSINAWTTVWVTRFGGKLSLDEVCGLGSAEESNEAETE